jgi:LmbE family N-acetylglucosaminyl deacetylase/glycosyltransferase involved in cell wall biosynthesis
MDAEENLIPFSTTDLSGKRVLVLAPHPDDETIGCGGSLAIHARAGDPVKVVFLTNGAAGDSSGEFPKDQYVNIRQQEARTACACLGVTDLEFWPYEDRSLAGSHGALRRLIDLLEVFRPDVVYAPSPLEFHPDHRAACVLLCDALHSYLPDLDVAFYEIGQPLRVNVLVNITGVSEHKIQAIDAYRSQLKERPYKDISLALDRYRSLTLSEGVTYAEGFSVWNSNIIRKIGPYAIPFQQMERLLPGPGEAGPLVSVIVRTKDRPALLANALKSIVAQTYANLEIVVVNDGGQDVRDVTTAAAGGIPVTYMAHEASEGRAAAANTGLKAARGLYLNFLDDDDVFYPDHVETLAQRLQAGEASVAYSSVVSAFFKGPPPHPGNCIKRVVNHAIDFDPDRLLFQNYLPLMGVMFHRDILSKVGAFDPALDLFEDWDFWIRASRHFSFQHVDRITAEYRFYGAQTTEMSHRRKYHYTRAQAQIFERVTPFLTGETWTTLLRADWLDELRVEPGKKAQGADLKQTEAALHQTSQRLHEAHALIERLETENERNREALEAIHASRGWRWLSRCGRWKRRLGLGPFRRSG